MRPTLKQLRLDRHLTQEQLAAAANCSQGSLSQWETGAMRPGILAAERLATALGVSLETLIAALKEVKPKTKKP
mgnify:CR=1 FL=1